jgi:hypothetical protein
MHPSRTLSRPIHTGDSDALPPWVSPKGVTDSDPTPPLRTEEAEARDGPHRGATSLGFYHGAPSTGGLQ